MTRTTSCSVVSSPSSLEDKRASGPCPSEVLLHYLLVSDGLPWPGSDEITVDEDAGLSQISGSIRRPRPFLVTVDAM